MALLRVNPNRKATGLNTESSIPGSQTEHAQTKRMPGNPAFAPEAMAQAVNFNWLLPDCLSLAFNITCLWIPGKADLFL